MPSLSDLLPGDHDRIRADVRVALIGGATIAAAMGAISLVVGTVTSAEARVLLETTTPSARFMASAVMTVSATTLALMLTLLSLSSGVDREIKGAHYERIRQIALVNVIAFIGATVLLVAIVVPLGDAAEIPARWYVGIYYGVSLLSAALGGVIVAVMLLLYAAVRDFIGVVSGDHESDLIADGAPAEGAERDD